MPQQKENLSRMSNKERIKAMFEQRIAAQECIVRDTAFRFDDESQEDFDAKIERRIKLVVVGLGHARNIPGINDICPYRNGMKVEWEGFYVSRNAVDQLDNVYIGRA